MIRRKRASGRSRPSSRAAGGGLLQAAWMFYVALICVALTAAVMADRAAQRELARRSAEASFPAPVAPVPAIDPVLLEPPLEPCPPGAAPMPVGAGLKPAPTTATSTATPTTATATVKADALNLRAAPNGRIIGSVGPTDELTVLEHQDGWLKVKTRDGRQGFVAARYVDERPVDTPAARSAPASTKKTRTEILAPFLMPCLTPGPWCPDFAPANPN